MLKKYEINGLTIGQLYSTLIWETLRYPVLCDGTIDVNEFYKYLDRINYNIDETIWTIECWNKELCCPPLYLKINKEQFKKEIGETVTQTANSVSYEMLQLVMQSEDACRRATEMFKTIDGHHDMTININDYDYEFYNEHSECKGNYILDDLCWRLYTADSWEGFMARNYKEEFKYFNPFESSYSLLLYNVNSFTLRININNPLTKIYSQYKTSWDCEDFEELAWHAFRRTFIMSFVCSPWWYEELPRESDKIWEADGLFGMSASDAVLELKDSVYYLISEMSGTIGKGRKKPYYILLAETEMNKKELEASESIPKKVEMQIFDKKEDIVNHPSHYVSGKYECYDVFNANFGDAMAKGYVIGNVFKYLWRFRDKNGVEDLKKARWYLDKAIELYSSEE